MTVFNFSTPITKEDVQKVNIGDTIYITGTIFTARDLAHKRAINQARTKNALPFNFENLAVYHCGPIVRKINNKWIIIAAGPTTSSRMELFQAEFIERFRVNVVIGKGGLGTDTTNAMKRLKAIYTAFVGGAGALAAKKIVSVEDVYWLDLGTPESIWVLKVQKFGPLLVAIDTKGNNLYQQIQEQVEKKRHKIENFLNIE